MKMNELQLHYANTDAQHKMSDGKSKLKKNMCDTTPFIKSSIGKN